VLDKNLLFLSVLKNSGNKLIVLIELAIFYDPMLVTIVAVDNNCDAVIALIICISDAEVPLIKI
jgi:hypothetical protein